MPVKGPRQGSFPKMFCHFPESWTQMREEQIPKKGKVEVNAVLRETNMITERLERAVPIEWGAQFYLLAWSVERL